MKILNINFKGRSKYAFMTDGGTTAGKAERKITWTLKDESGTHVREDKSGKPSFQIMEADFEGENALKGGKYTIYAEDEHNASDSMNLIIPKVEIKPWPSECIESKDSKKHKVKIIPEIEPDSYEWLVEGAFPEKAVFPTYKRQGKRVEMELQAWHVSNEKLPNHLEMTDEEIKKR